MLSEVHQTFFYPTPFECFSRSLASDQLKDAARAWIDKLSVKNGTYPPDSYPNPGNQSRSPPNVSSSICSLVLCLALAYHNAQLQASAFREEFDVEAFEDMTEPNFEKIHKVTNVLYYITSVSRALSSASRKLNEGVEVGLT